MTLNRIATSRWLPPTRPAGMSATATAPNAGISTSHGNGLKATAW